MAEERRAERERKVCRGGLGGAGGPKRTITVYGGGTAEHSDRSHLNGRTEGVRTQGSSVLGHGTTALGFSPFCCCSHVSCNKGLQG